MTINSPALPIPPREYNPDYMNRLVRQLNLIVDRINAIRPMTVGSDLSRQVVGYPVSGLTIVDIPTSPTGLKTGSVWSDAGVLKIVS